MINTEFERDSLDEGTYYPEAVNYLLGQFLYYLVNLSVPISCPKFALFKLFT